MKFFEEFFPLYERGDYSITGLNNELVSINIYNTFIRDNRGILVVANSTYEANLLYKSLLNYSNRVLFFPMDDFLTSEAIAISPEFMAERLNTLNCLSRDDKYIVVTNLMGALRYLPSKKLWNDTKVILKRGNEYNRELLLEKLYNMGYVRESIVNGTGQIGVRGYVIDVFPISSDSAVRIEFWGDEIDSIKYFDIDTQKSNEEISEIIIYPYTEFLLSEYSDNIIKRNTSSIIFYNYR